MTVRTTVRTTIRKTTTGGDSRRALARAATAALALSAVTACAGGDAPALAGVRSDSAGIAIVEHAAPGATAGASFRLAGAPSLVIGSTDAERDEVLHRVGNVRRLADGRIVVANGGAAEIRLYGGDGALQVAFGRAGEGPGEFRNLAWLGVTGGDSIVAYDGRLGRFALFAPDGALARSYRVGDSTGRGPIPRPFGVLADGSVMAGVQVVGEDGRATDGMRRDTMTFARIATDGGTRPLPARVAGNEWVVRVTAGGFSTVTPPFARTYLAAAGSDAAGGDRFCAADSGRYEVACYSRDGAPQLLLRMTGLQRAPTSDDLAARIALVSDAISNPGTRERIVAGMREAPLPQWLPAIGRVLIDARGRLWVMHYLMPLDTVATWTVFEADGRLAGSMTTPLALTVDEIGADYVLGVFRDENDVEQVRLYALARVR